MKTKTIYRIFVDYEKEEKWLNEMAQSGWALESFRLMRYVFKQVEPGTYTYRIELLSNLPSHPESKAYMAFLDEVGIEVVDTSYRWIFLRKRTSDGPFQLYSDFDSMIQREKRIIQLYGAVGLANFVVVVANLSNPYAQWTILLNIAVVAMLAYAVQHHTRKVRTLKGLKAIGEMKSSD